MADRWVKRWKVPKSDGEGFWTVAVDKNGVYGCSCPVWKFKRLECHHIVRVKANGGQEISLKPRPEYVLAKVLKPRYDEATDRLLIPLVAPGGSVGMEATICYYLMKHGYSFKEVREIRGFCIPASWTKDAIFEIIRISFSAALAKRAFIRQFCLLPSSWMIKNNGCGCQLE